MGLVGEGEECGRKRRMWKEGRHVDGGKMGGMWIEGKINLEGGRRERMQKWKGKQKSKGMVCSFEGL